MNGYVQDERYAAGAGMRRSGFSQIGTVSGVCGAIVSVLHGHPFMCGAIVSVLHGWFSLVGLERCVMNNAPYGTL